MHVRHLHGAQNISRTWYISASAGSSYSQLDLGQHANHWSLKGPEKKKKENEQVIFFWKEDNSWSIDAIFCHVQQKPDK